MLAIQQKVQVHQILSDIEQSELNGNFHSNEIIAALKANNPDPHKLFVKRAFVIPALNQDDINEYPVEKLEELYLSRKRFDYQKYSPALKYLKIDVYNDNREFKWYTKEEMKEEFPGLKIDYANDPHNFFCARDFYLELSLKDGVQLQTIVEIPPSIVPLHKTNTTKSSLIFKFGLWFLAGLCFSGILYNESRHNNNDNTDSIAPIENTQE